jgi:adenosylhomocysteine nucleosidase
VVTALPEERDGVAAALGITVSRDGSPWRIGTRDTRDSDAGVHRAGHDYPTIDLIPPGAHHLPGIDLPVALVATGAGKVAAAAGLTEILHHLRPLVLLCGGIAGSLDPALSPGTAMIGRRCWYYDRDATAVRLPLGAIKRNGPDRFEFPRAESLAARLGWPAGTIATGDSVVTAAIRDELPRRWRDRLAESSLVDMESAVWAEIADERGIETVICRTGYDVIGHRAAGTTDENPRLSVRDACIRSGAALVAVLRELPGSPVLP